MHTIYLRQHNRWAEAIKNLRPMWGDNQIYQVCHPFQLKKNEIIILKIYWDITSAILCLKFIISRRPVVSWSLCTSHMPTLNTFQTSSALRRCKISISIRVDARVSILFGKWMSQVVHRQSKKFMWLIAFTDTYNPAVNPSVSVEFCSGAYRFGHSQARKDIPRMTNKNV